MAQRIISLVITITWQIYLSAIYIINKKESINEREFLLHYIYNHELIYTRFDIEK